MKFDEMVAVSGLSGIFKMIANRSNGLIIEDIDSGKKKLAPARKHQFTPLASIGIYTGGEDTTELSVIFRTMRDQHAKNPPISPNSSGAELSAYFASILPEYDRDRVFSGDIKKVIKWFNFLNDRNLIPEEEVEEEKTTEEKEIKEDEKATKKETPKKESKKKSTKAKKEKA